MANPRSSFRRSISPDEYTEFKHEAFHALMKANEQYSVKFNIPFYPRWDYALEAATLTFSDAVAPRVRAAIQVAGSTSRRSNTWMWGWHKEDRDNPSTRLFNRVKHFGEVEGIAELVEPLLDADDDTGWELTAIAAKILSAQGAYRTPRDGGGHLYFILMDIYFVDLDATALDEVKPEALAAPREVLCESHGAGFPAYICGHLASNPLQQWCSDEPTDEEPYPDARCKDCDRILEADGEWTDENSGCLDLKLLCHYCYAAIRGQTAPI